MNKFIDVAVRLSEDAGFLDWQNEVIRDAYDALPRRQVRFCWVKETLNMAFNKSDLVLLVFLSLLLHQERRNAGGI